MRQNTKCWTFFYKREGKVRKMRKDVIELFAGVGGFRVGLNDIHEFDENGVAIENRDWNFVWSNQWEPSTRVQHAFECYQTRFDLHESDDANNPLHWCNKDISTVPANIIPNHSLLVGGFPCQDYSVARSLSGEKGICTIVSAGRDSRYNRGRRYFLWQCIKLSFGA